MSKLTDVLVKYLLKAKPKPKKTFKTNPMKIRDEHEQEVTQIETDAMRRAALKRKPTQ